MRKALSLVFVFGLTFSLNAQNTSSSHILHRLKNLQSPIRVLYFAAHPDDENTRMIAWLANDIGAQTAYFSITRGDGGQNLIGTELGAQLGVLRTQELMQARALDGGQQFFSRAVDFGYSKNPEETFNQWDREQVMSDAVRVIRQFRPHLIITRFPPDRRAGHGHHTASAMVALEAFDLAADETKFPEHNLEPWQVSRVFWNHSAWWEPKIDSLAANDPSYFVVDVGTYLNELGLSCNELASYSRSQHKSQGFGVSVARGAQKEYLKLLKGESSEQGIFGELPQQWGQLNYKYVEEQLEAIIQGFNPSAPYLSVDGILSLYQDLRKEDNPELNHLKNSLAEIAADCLGLKLELLATEEYAVAGEVMKFQARAIQRSPLAVSIAHPTTWPRAMKPKPDMDLSQNQLLRTDLNIELGTDLQSQAYWLREPYTAMFKAEDAQIGKPENAPAYEVKVAINVEGRTMYLMVPARYKFSDRVEGEIERPMMVVPELTVKPNTSKLFFLGDETKIITLDFRAFSPGEYKIVMDVEGWEITPPSFNYKFTEKDQTRPAYIEVRPKMGAAPAAMNISYSKIDEEGLGELSNLQNLVEIDYSHIDKRMILEDPGIRLIPLRLEIRGTKVAYVPGAGDKVPEGIMQMGYQVDILDETNFRDTDLSQYQAVIMGIRAYNTQAWLFNQNEQLRDYMMEGGNVIVQYNTLSRSFQASDFSPYSFDISRKRVTEEDAEVSFALPDHPVLNEPNKLGEGDFAHWVQERGLYFGTNWDQEEFMAPIAWHDQGEEDLLGGLLIAHYGKGSFMYTGISFFREMPAGVPGAYRLLANLISYQNGSW